MRVISLYGFCADKERSIPINLLLRLTISLFVKNVRKAKYVKAFSCRETHEGHVALMSTAGTDFGSERARVRGRRQHMLWTIFVILLLLWLLGMVSSYTLGGFIHILLVLAVVAVLIRLIQGRRPI